MLDGPASQSDGELAANPPTSVLPAKSKRSTARTRTTERAWIRRWGELREWRIIASIVVVVAPALGAVVGGWTGGLVGFGAPFGALARLYTIHCPDCGARFAKGRLAPMPSSCGACGTAAFDNKPQYRADSSPSDAAPVELPAPAEVRARRIARWDRLRKQLAAVQIAASVFGVVTLLDSAAQLGVSTVPLVLATTMVLVLTLSGIGGILLWRDHVGGVPLSLCYYALQTVLFHVESAWMWIVLGPYALIIIGADGPTASIGFTYGFANVEAVGGAPDWVGINLLALAACWFLWRRPWREMLAPRT